MTDIATAHEREHGVPPDVVVSAPGVVTLMGADTEFSDGLALGMATERRMQVAVSARPDNSLRFFSVSRNERKKTTIAGLRFRREDRWANHLKGVLIALARVGCPLRGTSITVDGNVPAGIGLGCSTAVGLAAAVAIQKLREFDLSVLQLVRAARNAEVEFLGNPNGLLDFFVSYHAAPNSVVYIDARTLEYTQIPLQLNGARFHITDVQIPVFPEDVEVLDRAQEMSDCVQALGNGKAGCALRDFSVDDLNEAMGSYAESVRRHCLHIVAEIKRVRESAHALRRQDPERLGKLMLRSHGSLRDLYEASYPELDWLVKRSGETEGVFGAKMLGNPQSFSSLVLLDEGAETAYTRRLEEYERIFGLTPDTFSCTPSQGVLIH